MLKIYLNGKIVPEEEAKVSVFDHGLLYGDGVFEGIRSYNGRVFKLKEHICRLFKSAKVIMLKIPLSISDLEEAILKTLRVNKLHDAYIRVVVTRGKGDLGLDPLKCLSPTLFIIASKIELYPAELYEKGLSLITVPTRRNEVEALNPAIKSLNYLNNILAKIEATNSNALEGIFLNSQGYVSECTGDNIFIYEEEKHLLLTPPVYSGALEGITRNCVIKLAKEEGIGVEEKLLTRYALFCSDEVFLTGSAAEIIHVFKIDGRVIGEGKKGRVTELLQKKFKELTQREGTAIYVREI